MAQRKPATTQNELLTPHPLYLALGLAGDVRRAAYREMFRHELEPGMIDQIRRATNGNFALGDTRFGEQIAQALGRRAQAGAVGRPSKAHAKIENLELFE